MHFTFAVSVTGEAVIEDVDVSEVPVKRAIKKTDKVGPRIKHVCRRANLVLPKSRATFPINNKPLLSALPSTEKKRLLQEDLEDDHPTGTVYRSLAVSVRNIWSVVLVVLYN